MFLDFIHDNSEEIAGFSTCFLVMQIDWQYEAFRFALGLSVSILSGWIVNKLKKSWDKPKRKKK